MTIFSFIDDPSQIGSRRPPLWTDVSEALAIAFGFSDSARERVQFSLTGTVGLSLERQIAPSVMVGLSLASFASLRVCVPNKAFSSDFFFGLMSLLSSFFLSCFLLFLFPNRNILLSKGSRVRRILHVSSYQETGRSSGWRVMVTHIVSRCSSDYG